MDNNKYIEMHNRLRELSKTNAVVYNMFRMHDVYKVDLEKLALEAVLSLALTNDRIMRENIHFHSNMTIEGKKAYLEEFFPESEILEMINKKIKENKRL